MTNLTAASFFYGCEKAQWQKRLQGYFSYDYFFVIAVILYSFPPVK